MTNNTFSFPRLGLLLRQNIYHNYKLLLLGAVAFCGAVFLLLLLFQTAEGFGRTEIEPFVAMFVTIFFIGAVLSAGTAFPYFRTKEKAIAYLLLPVSAGEKFVAEFLFRVVLFSVAVPILFWLVYVFEHGLVSLFASNYVVSSADMPDFTDASNEVGGEIKIIVLMCSMFFSIYMIPFMGSTIFNKAPLIKILFCLAIIIFFNAFLIYFIVDVLELKNYEPDGSILFIDEVSEAVTAGTWASVLINIGMIAVAFLKLKEKEA